MTKSSGDCGELEECMARYLIALSPGDQILSTRELSDTLEASTGSISIAMNTLEDSGAISINRRGRLGSFLESKSLGKLWRIIEDGPLVISLTMPSYPKIDGLATALYGLLNAADVETYLIFIRGSYNRLKALQNEHCHAAVTSSIAAEGLCSEKEEILLKFPPESFLTDHRVFIKKNTLQADQELRVGIDYDSYDIKFLTELEFMDQPVVFKRVTLMQIGRHLQEGYIDAAIWNIDHMLPYLDDTIDSRPLSPHVLEQVGTHDTSASIIVRSNDESTKIVLRETLDPEEITDIQEKVIRGELVPRY